MVWTGTAFRPPAKDDLEGWYVAAKIVEHGYCFFSRRARVAFPKRRSELAEWLSGAHSELWTGELTLKWSTTPSGAIVDLRAGRRVLRDHEPVLLFEYGDWTHGAVRLRGDGGVVLHTPLIRFDTGRAALPVTARMRVRLLRQR